MAEWIVDGEPSLDVWHMDIRRFGPHYRSPAYTLKRTPEVYETYYDIRYPGHERQAGRPLRVSSAYDVAPRARRRVRREVRLGAGQLVRVATPPPATSRCARTAGPGCYWSPAIGAEHRATRETAGLFDESSFAKLEVSGPGAAELLEWLCDNRVARDVGADHLHADAQPPRRDRVRLHGHPPGRGRASGSSPAPRSATTTRAGSRRHLPGGRLGRRHRRDRALGLLRAVGTEAPARSSRR